MEKLSRQHKFEALFKKASTPLKKSDCFGPPNYASPPQLSVFSTNISEYRPKDKNSKLFSIESHLANNIFDQKQIEKLEKAQKMKYCYLRTFTANKNKAFFPNKSGEQSLPNQRIPSAQSQSKFQKVIIDSSPIDKRLGINFKSKKASPSQKHVNIEKEWVDQFFWKKIGGKDNLRKNLNLKVIQKRPIFDKIKEIVDKKINSLSFLKNSLLQIDELMEYNIDNESVDEQEKEELAKMCLNDLLMLGQDEKNDDEHMSKSQFENEMNYYYEQQKFLIKSLLQIGEKDLALICSAGNKRMAMLWEKAYKNKIS